MSSHLPAEEQRLLVIAWQKNRDHGARKLLLSSSERLATYVASRFVGCSVDQDDLRQESRIAIMRAIDRYDPGYDGGTFFAYAHRAAFRACKTYVARYGGVTTMNEPAMSAQGFWRRLCSDLSLDEPMWADGAETRLSVLSTDATQEDDIEQSELAMRVHSAMASVVRGDHRLRLLAVMRILSPGEVTLRQVGDCLGVTGQMVHQLERLIFERLEIKLRRRVDG